MNKNRLLDLIILLSILNSGSLIVKTFGDDIFYLIELFLVFILFINSKSIKVNLIYYLVFTCLIFFHAFFHQGAFYSYLGLLVRVLSIFILSRIVNSGVFWEKYNRIIYIIALLSLIGFVAINILPKTVYVGFSQIFMLYDPGSDHYYNNLFIITWLPRYFTFIIRNQSIFWEPGAFQFFVNIALMINLKKERLLAKRNVIYIITIFSTLSTTGYVVLLLILLDYSIKNIIFTRKLIFKNLLVLFVLIFIVFQSQIIQNKFSYSSTAYKSFATRLLDAQVDLILINDNYLIGYGYGDKAGRIWEQLSSSMGGSSASSNSLLFFIGQFGLFISFVYLFPLLFNKSYINSKIIFLFVLLIFISTEYFITSYIFISLMYFPLKDIKIKNVWGEPNRRRKFNAYTFNKYNYSNI